MNTLLVVGSATCVREDVDRALALRPFASLMLVNGACTIFENAEHVLAGHTEKAKQFADARRAVFPNASPWRLHATCLDKHRALEALAHPYVTDWWSEKHNLGSTSIAKGASIGLCELGFDEVILCGSPMDGSGYSPLEASADWQKKTESGDLVKSPWTIPQSPNCLRIGDSGKAYGHGTLEVQEAKIIKKYRAQYRELSLGVFKDRVFSMSGFTRECSGEPKEI